MTEDSVPAAKVKGFVRSRGATLVGIASIARFSKAPKGHHPKDFLPKVRTVISIGLRMNRFSILRLPKTIREYKADYDMVNLKLNSLAWETARFLEEQGYEAMVIPASSPYNVREHFGDLSHKHAAVAAGLGRFGLNNLVLTPKYGPLVRFVTVITNAKSKPDKLSTKELCLGQKCMKCVRICPAKALEKPVYDPSEGWRMNKERCHGYIYSTFADEVCGLCIKACPLMNHR